MGSEKERIDTQQAQIYEIRRALANEGKSTFTLEELFKLLDTMAETKSKE